MRRDSFPSSPQNEHQPEYAGLRTGASLMTSRHSNVQSVQMDGVLTADQTSVFFPQKPQRP